MRDDTIVRKAKNEVAFRDANEGIEALRLRLTHVRGKTPFICECEDPTCRTIIRMDVDEYDAVRAEPNRFLVADGHPTSASHVVAEGDGYAIVEKAGIARAIAEATDPRRS
jgi:hypothetical protein